MKRILKLFCLVLFVNSFAQTVAPSGISTTENYVYSRSYLEPVTTSSTTAKQMQSVGYFDGLGRAKQSIAIKASASGKDVATTIIYDAFGRQVKDYLPVPQSGTQSGGIYPDPLLNSSSVYGSEKIYSEKVLENSPLDRIQQQIQLGNDWASKPVNFTYEANDSLEVKKYTATSTWVNNATSSTLSVDGNYPEATLYKNTVTDEDGNVSIEFKNGEGQTLLVRKNDGTNNVDTYYVYNEFNQLAFVIPPLAAAKASISQTDLDNLCYQYRYDGRNRLVEKKLPGKGWEYMVYDKQDRLVLTQDANLRTTTNNFLSKGWLFTKYDQFGRVVYTGFFKNTATRSSMQTALNNMAANPGNNELRVTSPSITLQGLPLYYTKNAFPTGSMTLLSVNYYDTYPPGAPAFDNILAQSPTPGLLTATYTSDGRSTKSLPLASFVKNIETDAWTKNYTFYDTKARAFATYSFNYLGGYTKTESELDFAGTPQRTYTFHKRLTTDTEVQIKERFAYNTFNNALEKHWHQVNSHPEELLTENTYNELGQLINKKVGNTIASPLQSIDYSYNIRGWITGINDPNNLGTNLFGYKIKYNNVDGLQVPNLDFPNDKVLPKYNGNIAEIDWKTATTPNDPLRRYGYVYDGINRLTAGFYQNAQNPSAKEYFEHLLYDSNGNITELKRSSAVLVGNTTASLIDNLAYTYTGNQLQTVADAQQNSDGYPYFATPNTITYDSNGNMTSQKDKGISSISYNFLNLPNNISAIGLIKYCYKADGTKVKKESYGPFATGIMDYLDGFQYNTTLGLPGVNYPAVLQFIPTSEGYYDFLKNAYIYNYTDHLGNVRLSYYKNSAGVLTIDKESNYYPFGLEHTGYNNLIGNLDYNYKFLGQELQETGFYDLNARFYLPDIAIFGQHDPLSEQTLQPYAYGYNNPIMFKDPTGMSGESTHTDRFGNVVAVYNDGDNGVYKHNGNESQTQAELNSSYSSNNTSGGGTKMGETQYWDEFANHDSNGNILGDKTGNFANKDAQIFYGVPIDDYMQKSANYAKLGMEAQGSASGAKDWLATNSARHAKLDIKDRLGAHNGYLLNGKYVSGETAGNYLFGTNLNTLREFATLDNIRYPFTNKESVFYRAAEAFGAYHNSSNKVNNPSVRPYYGEIPYSGRGIVNGYYRTTNNPVFNAYPTTAIYGKIKIK